MKVTVNPRGTLKGEFSVPSDKSISQRSVILGAIANGTTRVSNLLDSDDVNSAIGCVRALGIKVDPNEEEGTWEVHGRGLHGFFRAWDW